MRSRILVLALVMCAIPAAVVADEGMWPVDMLDKLPWAELKAMGLSLRPDQIYDGKGHGLAHAVVSFGGGTGSFVSPNGLILTNHHVAFRAIQRASTPEHNYIANGFYAPRGEDEIQAPGYNAYVLVGIEEITKNVLSAVTDGMSGLERHRAIERRIKALVAEAEKGRDVECRIASFYNGLQFKLYTYFVCKDVRIVFVPPESVGNYGGDVDNWMWPRHTGDFALLRAYIAPNRSSAEYAAENVPYRSDVYVPMSMRGVKENEFAMIIGYPGRTGRHMTSHGIADLENYFYPRRVEIYRGWLGILQEEAARGEDIAIKTASFDQMLNNSMKNNEGMLEGFKKGKLLQRKLDTEKSFATWLAMNPAMQDRYGDVLAGIAAVYEEKKAYREKSMLLGLMTMGCQMLGAGSTLERWSEEKAKLDLDREPGYQERDVPQMKRRLRLIQMSYDPQTDRRVLAYFLDLAARLPADQRIAAVDAIIAGAAEDQAAAKIDSWLDRLYAGTKLGLPEERARLFDLSRKELLAVGDPFIDFAAALGAEKRALEEREDAVTGALDHLGSRYMEAVMTWKGGAVYPDANGTMRLTYGRVQGYRPRDAVRYHHATSLAGVVEKHTGEDPFNCPARLLELAESMDYGQYEDPELKDVPVNYLSTCDITGGNSGSPVVNGRGECVGAAFDGDYESISSDYLFRKQTTRSINVDSRYVLFILDRMSGARRLLDEMKIR